MLTSRQHYSGYLIGLTLILIGLPLSKFAISLGILILLLNWFIEGNFKSKLQSCYRHPVSLGLITLFALHLVGMIYTEDISFGLKDLRIKLPILLFALVFPAIPPIRTKHWHFLLGIFIVGVFSASVIGIAIEQSWVDLGKDPNNPRELSLFTSHIRLSLMIVLSIYFLLYKLVKEKNWINWVFLPVSFFLIYFMSKMESLTGYLVLIISATTLLIYLTSYLLHSKRIKFLLLFSSSATFFIFCLYVFQEVNGYYQASIPTEQELAIKTAQGNSYHHSFESRLQENGNFVWLFFCEKELEDEWQLVSDLPLYGEDQKGQVLFGTLVRYMTSLGLKKDAEGVIKLSTKDIQNIESGQSVAILPKNGLSRRIKEMVLEYETYRSGGNPSGKSMLQRLEYWKTGVQIFKKNPIIGVGTGDTKNAFKQQYILNQTKLKEEFRHRTHNQFLTIALTFGSIGFLIFVLSLAISFWNIPPINRLHFLIFSSIYIASFLAEDTLETQVGATFFSFFYCFLLLLRREDRLLRY